MASRAVSRAVIALFALVAVKISLSATAAWIPRDAVRLCSVEVPEAPVRVSVPAVVLDSRVYTMLLNVTVEPSVAAAVVSYISVTLSAVMVNCI